jgi:hypothetical protein
MGLNSVGRQAARSVATASLLFTILFSQHQVVAQGPPLLSYADLVRLYEIDPPPEELQARLTQLLNRPFVSNTAATRGRRAPQQASSAASSAFAHSGANAIRIATWNIERGLEFDAVKAAFTHNAVFFSQACSPG